MNKKIIAAACGLLIGSSFAFADDMNFYVGGDFGYNKLGYASDFKDEVTSDPINGKAKSKVPSFGLLAGAMFHENVGAELGYTFYKKAKITGTGLNDEAIKLSNIHLDLLGYMPVDKNFELVGLVGFGRMRLKESGDANDNAINEKAKKMGFRLGAGVQYNIDNHFAVRGMVKYQKANLKSKEVTDYKFMKHTTSLNLGVTYTI